MATSEYRFNISLSVLNHLGRSLYRNFITILGEAISNCWDADAENIQITLDHTNNRLIITDDGEGMSSSDFEEKFLLVGYSKRGAGQMRSSKDRPYIGRKGIGKLALLSCAKQISIYTQQEGEALTGGTINNETLDDVLNSESTSQKEELAKEYALDKLDPEETKIYEKKLAKGHGTVLVFKMLTPKVPDNIQLLRSQIALYFRFSLLPLKGKFEINFNGEPISVKDLQTLANDTEFVWKSKGFTDPYLDLTRPSLLEDVKEIDTSQEDPNIQFKFFVASVAKPRNLNIHGAGEKTGIDLFVNGRLRENNIMRRQNLFSTNISSSYLYGQIHCNFLDEGGPDRFTTSREGVLDEDDTYSTVLTQLENILAQISRDWKELRKAHKKSREADDTDSLSDKKALYSQQILQVILEEIAHSDKISDAEREKILDRLKKAISSPDGQNIEDNIAEYAQLFVIENYLRFKIDPSDLNHKNTKTIQRWKDQEELNKNKAALHIDIRHKMDDLEYLSITDLARLLDLAETVKPYVPIRDAVAHTGKLTKEARQLSLTSYDNIIAGIRNREKDS